MLHIIKNNKCHLFGEYKRRHNKSTYADLHNYNEGEKQEKIRIYNEIKNSIFDEQYGLCCYCCNKIDIDKSNIEHIAPCSDYPKISLQYENMLLSCNNDDTCNYRKGNKYDKLLFVSPLDVDCEKYFEFNIYTGAIVSSKKNDNKAKYTIDTLNLNSPYLKEKRKQIIKKIYERIKYNNETKEEIMNNYVLKHKQLSDVVKYYIQK